MPDSTTDKSAARDRAASTAGTAAKNRSDSRAAPLVYALFVAWAACLALAIAWGSTQGHATAVATGGRMGASVALVLAGCLAYRESRSTPAARFLALIALGMALGTLGDFYNADLLNPIAPLGQPILGGMISFGIGHVAYIAACLIAAVRANLRDAKARNIWLVGWLVVATIGWYAIVYLGADDKTRNLVWPAFPYSLLLASTAGLASGLAAQHRGFLPLAVGAALFFVSDMLLACGLFRGSLPYQTELVWLTYSPGQMLIVFGAWMARGLLTAPHGAATSQQAGVGAAG